MKVLLMLLAPSTDSTPSKTKDLRVHDRACCALHCGASWSWLLRFLICVLLHKQKHDRKQEKNIICV
jgi:hypothetical protein